MIKFKEFDVGDIHYEEQIEQFQKEHQNAEFVQITGGYTSYEKIWFKYEDRIDRPELNENQQIVLDWLKENVGQDNASPMCAVFLLGEWQTRIGSKELRSVDISYCRLNPKQQAEVLQAFSQWAIEQEEAE